MPEVNHGPLPPLELPDLPGLELSELRVDTHPALPSFTEFPPCLVEKLAGSYRLSWQPRNDRSLSMLRHVQIHPVYTEDYAEELLARLKREGFTRESLKEGMVWNGDCVLCAQPLEAFEAQTQRLALINRRREAATNAQDSLDSELQRLAELTGHRTGNRLVFDQVPGGNTDVTSQVLVDKRLKDPSGHRQKPSTAPGEP